MSLFIFLTVIQAIVAAGLVLLVLMQRSEGGGLGVGGGGSPGGLMSARGAADFLTRATKWFAVFFVSLSIVLAAVAVDASGQRDFDQSLDRSTGNGDIDLLGDSEPAPVEAPAGTAPAPEPTTAPAPADDPLANVE